MNFSHYNIVKKQRELKSPSRRIFSLLRLWLFRLAIVAMAFAMVVGSFGAYGAYKGLIDTAPSIDSISVNPELFASVILDSDGNKIVELVGAGTSREYAPIAEIPEDVRNCFIAMEDERFYEHKGVDIAGIFRAAFSVVKEGSLGYGASTITQQLLKNQVFGGGKEKSSVDKIVRKVQEQYLAVRLEDRLDKDTILEYYLNTINLGNGAYGIASASQKYFGKTVGELTISEAAVIAPVAYSPTLLNPLRDEERNRDRRKGCLDNLLNAGFCDKAAYDAAIEDTDAVYDRLRQYADATKSTEQAEFSYFVDELIDQLIIDLKAKGYNDATATSLLYTGGLTINTTQDTEIQNIMDGYFTDESYFPQVKKSSGKAAAYWELRKDYAFSIVGQDNKTSKHYHLNDLLDYYQNYEDNDQTFYHESGRRGINVYTSDKEKFQELITAFEKDAVELFEAEHPDLKHTETRTSNNFTIQPQCAMVIMDQTNGAVVAQYGGRGVKTGNRVLNRASDAYRQAGSTFKVVASFLPAIDTGNFTLASVFDDAYYQYPGRSEIVHSWYSGYKGLSTIREGIYDSRNCVAVRCCQAVTATVAVNYLLKLGFSRIDTDGSDGKSDYNVAIALGGLTNGVTVLEMTAAYAAIANGGNYIKPRYYDTVLDHEGNTLLDNTTPLKQRAMKATTSYLLTSALYDTVRMGTGKTCEFNVNNIPVAGKTGTAKTNYDLWFAGFTPYYTASVWSGYDNNFEQKDSTNYSRKLWKYIMESVHKAKNCQKASFPRPSGIVGARICTKCGKLAVDGLCDKYEGGNCVKDELFAAGTAPTQKCDCHEKLAVCADTGLLATDECPNPEIKVFLIKVEPKDSLDHGGTDDTEFIFPEEKRKYCTVHEGHNPIDPDKPLPTKTPTPTPAPPDSGDTEN